MQVTDQKGFSVDADEIEYVIHDITHVSFNVLGGIPYALSEIQIDGATPSNMDDFEDKFGALFPDTDNGTGGSVLFGTIGLETAATFSAINASTDKRLIIVTADETNNGDKSLYLHDGTTKIFLQTIAP